jgi:hypothetical protein
MRPNLHLLTDRRTRLRQRGARHGGAPRLTTAEPDARQAEIVREVLGARRQPPRAAAAAQAPSDPAVGRARAAGGPLDEAFYACQCGYLFAAPVSTTVACPHCGGAQAW